jgi:hypothetical protein
VYSRPSRGNVIEISSLTFLFPSVYVSFFKSSGERPLTTPMGSPLTDPTPKCGLLSAPAIGMRTSPGVSSSAMPIFSSFIPPNSASQIQTNAFIICLFRLQIQTNACPIR